MHYVAVCRSCYPDAITVVGWASTAHAWRGVHHTPHPETPLAVLEVSYLPLYAQQKRVEGMILEIAKAGGYERVHGRTEIDLALNDPEIAALMRRLAQLHRGLVNDTDAYIRRTFAFEIESLLKGHGSSKTQAALSPLC